jgi:hypothetical protein
MGETGSFKTSVTIYQTICLYIQENSSLHDHHHENLKSQMDAMLHTYEHSGTSATHISLDTSCRSHPSISAFAWFKYERCRILSPLPHVTEHTLHSEYSVTPHSATGIQLFHTFINTLALVNNSLSANYVIQNVPEGKANILRDHSIGHCKQKSVDVHVSYSKWFPR